MFISACSSTLTTDKHIDKNHSIKPLTTYPVDNEIVCKTAPQTNRSQSLDGEDIQLVSWNIYKGNKPGWKKDLYRLSNNQSVFVLQEAPLLLIEQTLKSDPDTKDWTWQFAPGYKASRMQTGVLTFTRSPASYFCHLRHKEPWLRSPKASLITRYAIGDVDTELLVANIHGINFTLGVHAYRQQIEDLKNIISEHRGPVIIAGDFNSWSKKRNRVLAEVFEQLQLKQVEFESSYRKAFLGHPLDHVYFRGLEIKSRRVHQLDSSDHNPIQVNFRVESQSIQRRRL